MSENTINPFKDVKRTNWAKKTQDRHLIKDKIKKEVILEKKKEAVKVQEKQVIKNKEKKPNVKRVVKSFKVYPGKIPRDFEKRVNKLQVHFDDKDFDKNYVDSGKYLMFLMAFAEQYNLHELYKDVNAKGDISISQKEIINHIGKVFDTNKN